MYFCYRLGDHKLSMTRGKAWYSS